mgnify:CR=1 FL=1
MKKLSQMCSSALGVFVLAGCDLYVADTPGHSRTRSVVSYSGPRLVLVVGTSIEYAPEEDDDIFFYRDQWYAYREGVWFRSSIQTGPWLVVRTGRLPRAFAQIPPGNFKHRRGNYHPVHEHHPGLGWDRVENEDGADGHKKKRKTYGEG